MKDNWLWDRKIGLLKAKSILKDPDERDFILLASLLLSRKNEPKEVFRDYIKPLLFCKYWPAIKKRMRRDKWNEPRIIFWQAIYEKLIDRYRKKGVAFRKETVTVLNPLYAEVGRQISNMRREQGLSQKKMASKLGVSQQLISRIEKGRENISLSTLNNISRALGKKVAVDFI